jgi:anti-sigma B factor antagonist
MTEAPDSGDDALTADPSAIASFRVEEMQGRAVVVACGEIDMTTAPRLREALGAAPQVSAQVVVDLTSVTFLDSSGIAVLIDALKQGSHGHQMTLCLAGAAARVRRVLDITRVSRMLPTYETLAEALEQPT